MFTRGLLAPAVLSLALAMGTASSACGQGPYYHYGSWGSSGGSYGSWGSSGGSWGSSGGSSGGSWGSSGGSWGSSGGSYGSYGSYGSHGSSGSSGSWGAQPVYPQQPSAPLTRAQTPVESYSAFETMAVADRSAARDESLRTGLRGVRRALIELEVPEKAVVFLNGQQMTLVGSKRTYFSQPLESGKAYLYSVEVETVRNRQSLRASLSQRVTPGDVVQLEAVFKKAGDGLLLRPASARDGAIASRQIK
jgi:uncharacterized protein (TIGR03000 family)